MLITKSGTNPRRGARDLPEFVKFPSCGGQYSATKLVCNGITASMPSRTRTTEMREVEWRDVMRWLLSLMVVSFIAAVEFATRNAGVERA
jgi:hypothetical protein